MKTFLTTFFALVIFSAVSHASESTKKIRSESPYVKPNTAKTTFVKAPVDKPKVDRYSKTVRQPSGAKAFPSKKRNRSHISEWP